MKTYHLLLISLILVSIFSQSIWPKPQQINQKGLQKQQVESTQKIVFNINNLSEIPSYIQTLVSQYSELIFNDKSRITFSNQQQQQNLRENGNNFQINVQIDNIDLKSVYTTQEEQYSLEMYDLFTTNIKTSTYVGFVRAIESWSQTFTYDLDNKIYSNTGFNITDQPDVAYRGILIDLARNYLSVAKIEQMIDAMMFNKVNCLHIHFSDNESFSLLLEAYPSIAKNSAFVEGQYYTQDDIKNLINYGLIRGVRIIPEVESPAKTYSWTNDESIKDINILCDGYINGQLDITMDETYTVVENILKQVNEQFNDEYVHFGGKKANNDCYNKRPSIQEYMTAHNISSYDELQKMYRQNEQKIWTQNIKSTKKNIFWVGKTNIDFVDNEVDTLEFIGNHDEIDVLQDIKNPIIVSLKDYFSLDKGFGTVEGDQNPLYNTWLEIYDRIDYNSYQSLNIDLYGVELALWGELVNDNTVMSKTWIRSSSMAERTWNKQANDNQVNNTILVKRLQVQVENMQRRGISTSPLTTEYCTTHPEICFYNH